MNTDTYVNLFIHLMNYVLKSIFRSFQFNAKIQDTEMSKKYFTKNVQKELRDV